MNANDSLERGITDVYERDAPARAPDWVLAAVLESIESTPQRRALIRVPWRLPTMSTFAKVAIAAVVVIAIGAVGLSLLSPRSPSAVGGLPSASASPAASPSPLADPSPSASPDPSAPPPLSSTFTSTMHGISIAYPDGWRTTPATEAWDGVVWGYDTPQADVIYDPARNDHLFMNVASRPLGAESPKAWVEGITRNADPGCTGSPETITIDGADARLCGSLAYVAAGGRAYMLLLYTSGDEAWLERSYDTAWFKRVLDTVQLRPDDAVDTSAAPAASPAS